MFGEELLLPTSILAWSPVCMSNKLECWSGVSLATSIFLVLRTSIPTPWNSTDVKTENNEMTPNKYNVYEAPKTKLSPILMIDMELKQNSDPNAEPELKLTERKPSVMADEWLEGTILGALYPDIKLMLLTIPTCADHVEKAAVQDKMCCITWPAEGGTRFKMIGGSGSAKNGKFYFADEKNAAKVKERFLNWPEAAVTYLGINTSSCKVVKTFKNASIAIVPDLFFGTNDCEGWMRESMVSELGLKPGHIYQCREAFDYSLPSGQRAYTQTKGLRKVMSDEVADILGVDMIVPESSVKPLPTKKVDGKTVPDLPEFKSEADIKNRTWTSDLVVAVRETSRVLKFASSYSILQHASWEVINQEIIPQASAVIRTLKTAWEEKNHLKVIEMIGKKMTFESVQEEGHEVDEDADDKNEIDGYQAVESILFADGSGEITRHPYVYKTLSKLIAKWAYKTCTGGGLELPGFTLAGDGFLVAIDGKIVSGSNWIPLDTAIISDALTCERGLCCRYPVRCAEDLLPMKHASLPAVIAMLIDRGLPEDKANWIAMNQLCLTGTYTLHQDTAKRNGGDFDGDMICVIDGDKYPMFTDFRFNMVEQPPVKKIKAERLKSMWYNLESIAMGAMGNQIGVITNLVSACIASAKELFVYEYDGDSSNGLVAQLQKEIDSLKHNTCADKAVIKAIRDQAPKPLWLDLKNATSLKELPMSLEVLPTDRIGMCYNVLREEIDLMMGTPMQVSQFAGLLVGNTPTKQMFDECTMIKTMHYVGHEIVRKRTDAEAARVRQAKENLDSLKGSQDLEAIRKARLALQKANNAQKMGVDWSKDKAKNLGKIIASWAASKHTNRKAWAQAMHKLVHNSKSPTSTGSLGIHAFPQEFVDAMVERTGGLRSVVAVNVLPGEVVMENGCELWLYKGIGSVQEGGSKCEKVRLLKYDAQRKTLTK
jgi:hypothetical protein